MGTFYAIYLSGGSIQHAVSADRRELRDIQSKPGRYAVDVFIDDSRISVLYQNHRDEVTLPAEVEPLSTFVPDIRHSLSGVLKPKTEADISPPIIGKNADILLLEAAVADFNIVNIVGGPGVGNTAFKEHVAEWWESSNFVERSFQFDFVEDKKLWNGSTIYGRIMTVLGVSMDGQAGYENVIHRSRYAVFIDNFGVLSGNTLDLLGYLSSTQLQPLLNGLRRFSEARNATRSRPAHGEALLARYHQGFGLGLGISDAFC